MIKVVSCSVARVAAYTIDLRPLFGIWTSGIFILIGYWPGELGFNWLRAVGLVI